MSEILPFTLPVAEIWAQRVAIKVKWISKLWENKFKNLNLKSAISLWLASQNGVGFVQNLGQEHSMG